MSRALRQEIPRILIVFVCGSLLHFTHAWSGQNRVVAIFSAVNESVWEHCKMAFWPALLLALLLHPKDRRQGGNPWIGRALGLLVIPAVIIGGFHGYTALLGRHLLLCDILLFLLAVALGQLTGRWILSRPAWGDAARLLGIGLLLVQVLAYALFTFHPPRIDLFLDHDTGSYGIPAPR